MTTENQLQNNRIQRRRDDDEEETKATPKFRVDAAHSDPPEPHAFSLPDAGSILRLALWLNREDLTLQEFGEKLARHKGLSQYVVACANHSAIRREAVIRDPVHAAAYLGISRLRSLMGPLIPAGTLASELTDDAALSDA